MVPHALLDAIQADPEVEALRLIYADWLEEQGDPRSEFIRVQCALARLGDPVARMDQMRETEWFRCRSEAEQFQQNVRYQVLKAREQQLLTALEPTWVAPLWELIANWPTRRTFRRGFVEYVRISPKDFTSHADTLFQQCPLLRHLRLESDDEYLPAALLSSQLGRVEHLDLGHYLWLQEAQLAALVSSPHLARLQTLRIGDGMNDGEMLSAEALRSLAQAPLMANLKTLVLECDAYVGDSPERVAEVDTLLGRQVCLVDPCN